MTEHIELYRPESGGVYEISRREFGGVRRYKVSLLGGGWIASVLSPNGLLHCRAIADSNAELLADERANADWCPDCGGTITRNHGAFRCSGCTRD